jgi:hypothetical protein
VAEFGVGETGEWRRGTTCRNSLPASLFRGRSGSLPCPHRRRGSGDLLLRAATPSRPPSFRGRSGNLLCPLRRRGSGGFALACRNSLPASLFQREEWKLALPTSKKGAGGICSCVPQLPPRLLFQREEWKLVLPPSKKGVGGICSCVPQLPPGLPLSEAGVEAGLSGRNSATQPVAAVTTISTFHDGSARRASTVARDGALPGATHASHARFIAAKSAMSAR